MNNIERLYLIKAAGSTQPTSAQDYGNAANMAAQPLLNIGASL